MIQLKVTIDSEGLHGEYLVRDEKYNVHNMFYLEMDDAVPDCTCRSESDSCDHIKSVGDYRDEHPPRSELDDFPERPDSWDSESSIEDGFPSRSEA